MASPTSRSLQYCRKHGLVAGVVERWNPYAKIRQDLLGFIDIIVLDGGIVGVQATSGSHAANRIDKIKAEPRAQDWLESGGRIEVWSWRKIKRKRGGTAFRYELDRRVVDEDHLSDASKKVSQKSARGQHSVSAGE